jgi:rubrerythrin
LFSLKDIIALAVQIENNGEEIYRSATGRNASHTLSQLLSWIADEEARHGEWLEELGRKTEPVQVDGAMEKMGRIMLRSSVEDQSFSLNEADLSNAEDARRLLAMSIEFEKDTVAFYQMMRAFLQDPEAIAALDRIIEEEQRHIESLGQMRKELEQQAPSGQRQETEA